MDVIVIGSGPIGALVARRLADKGKQVLIIEEGKAISTPPGSHLRNQQRFQEDPDAFFSIIDKLCTFYDPHALPEGLPGANKTEGFGGQGLIWFANCPRSPTLWNAMDIETWNLRYSEAEALFDTRILVGSSREEKIRERLSGYSLKNIPKAGTLRRLFATYDILDEASVEVMCGLRVEKLEVDHGVVHQVVVRDVYGDVRCFEAENVVVAAGPIETPQLLWNSGIHLDALGHYLHFHPVLFAQVVLDEALSVKEAIPPRLCISPTEKNPWYGMVIRDLSLLKSKEPVKPEQLLELQFFASMEVKKENRILREGGFKVHLSEKDVAIMKRMEEEVNMLGNLLGAFRKGCEPVYLPHGMAHIMGTFRMGIDPKTSVVDNHGKVHGFSNLYLAGLGVIPISIAVNPTLTAAAVALQAVEAIS